ncbi:SDR family oxidoreductase [Leptospira kanakyensis]|uniref:SDR family oxidoreductase n=1 Tax=Leptospira kanakyensis TaxID=2484968 RepID=A0A6N4Q279_9LEPT|nr:SDR family oxidoreductase [Leptospira kanakyensis]TGK51913.1 SDR family oxidoreductase [Leptospira kanakyensis]TGK57179.1 SDR family oxidoreductase [Leptospira kanakyensis]TGK71805.1 SDR family oxidoreductase [Leptospira kanakyensis]
MSKILITGGFGYLGGRIAKYLSSLGHLIVLGSRVNQSSPNWLPNCEVRQMDWKNQTQLSEVCREIDIIVHAAGMNAQDCSKNPIEAIEFNSLATSRLIEATRVGKIKKFINLSTAHVYGSPLVGTITEETCTRNYHPYASSHLMAEFAVNFASSQGYFQGVNLRLSNGFGSPTHKEVATWGLLANDLCRQVFKSKSLHIHSNKSLLRDFIPIKNIETVIGKISDDSFNITFPHVNLASGKTITIFQMAELIQSRVHILYGYLPKIITPESSINEKSIEFNFDITLLKNLDLYEFPNMHEEVDRLLVFCKNDIE